MASTSFKNNRSYSKSMGKKYKTIPYKKRHHGSVKCNHIKALFVDQDNLVPGISENNKDKSDLTLIILIEQNKYYKYYNTDTANNNNNSKANKIPPIVK
jgi:hypothetical protein